MLFKTALISQITKTSILFIHAVAHVFVAVLSIYIFTRRPLHWALLIFHWTNQKHSPSLNQSNHNILQKHCKLYQIFG